MSVTPKRRLGQHFLADRNVLGVIERLSDLDAEDVVVEIGPGLGVLTTYLADRVAHVHAIELDRSLASPLGAVVGDRANVSLRIEDALAVDLTALSPAPTKLVSNLPYNVATPIVVETLLGVPALRAWCVMVQREVADRFFASPGSKAYGAVSVLVRLHARRTGFHPVARTVFRPVPNVDSALVAFERIDPPARTAAVRRVVVAAFAHRRKTLANSLALAGVVPRDTSVTALETIGRAPGVRAEALEPDEFVALTEALPPMSDWLESPAHAKVNLALVVGPLRADGKHEVVTVMERLSLADTIAVRRGRATRVEGLAEDTLVAAALEALGSAAGARFEARIEKRIPLASGLGGGSSDAATALRLANTFLDAPLDDGRLHAIAAGLGADVPFFLRAGPQLATGDGTTLEAVVLPRDYTVLLALPPGDTKRATADVYRAFDERDGAEGFPARAAEVRDALATVASVSDLTRLPPNDLATSPLAATLVQRGAVRADVSGAGPVVYGLFVDAEQARATARTLQDRATWIVVPA